MNERMAYLNSEIPGNYQFKALYHGPVSQRIWHRNKFELVNRFIKGKSFEAICDAGCGSGILTEYLSRLMPNASVTGFDLNENSIEFAKRTFVADNLSFQVKDLLNIFAEDYGKFDLILSFELIEHFSPKNICPFLKNLGKIGKDPAWYLMTTPDYHSTWPAIEAVLDLLKLTPPMADHQHLTKFSIKTFSRTVADSGFEVMDIGRFCGNSPFLAHISVKLSERVNKLERKIGFGNLIYCLFRKKKMRLCVILPVFNEEDNISDLVENLFTVIDHRDLNLEICAIDDGSRDESLSILKSLEKKFNVKVIEFSRNFGKDMAILAGLENSCADLYVVMDSDGQHPPEAIPKMLKCQKDGDFNIVNGKKNKL